MRAIKPDPPEVKPVPEVALKQIRIAMAILDKLEGSQYAIKLPDGQTFCKDMEVVPERKKGKPRASPGALSKYFLEQLKSMEIGDVLVTPAPPDIAPERLRSCMSAHATSFWGKGGHKSHVTVDGSVEVLRIA